VPLVLWDASALAKRFVAEVGTQTVNAVFSCSARDLMVTSVMCFSETFAALLRKHNQGIINSTVFNAAQALLRTEVIDDADFVVLGLEFDDILDGIELVKRHNLNSADGAILQTYLRYTNATRPPMVGVLVASDQRLLRAAKAEGLEVLNPEVIQPVDVPALLAAL
jgi:predicted nucleic acid-binding protein